jgi:protein gp37
MMGKTKIEWTATYNADGSVTAGASWNPIRAMLLEKDDPDDEIAFVKKIGWFCVHVSPGCINCYSETMNRRLGTGIDYKAQNAGQVKVFLDEKMLLAPLKWKKPRKVFVCSMSDLFADFVTDEMIDQVFAVMALCPHLTFQALTKRPERMREYCKTLGKHHSVDRVSLQAKALTGTGGLGFMWELSAAGGWHLPNVWLGTSVEDQQRADERIPHLLATPAAVRFLSVEPLLGPIDLYNGDPDPRLGGHQATKTFIGDWWEAGDDLKGPSRHGVDWVIVGGESGPNARPMHPDWARSLRDQCAAAEVPFFFKQWGEWGPDDGPPNGAPDRIMEGRARAAWRDGTEWTFAASGYDIPAFSGEGEWVYRLGKQNTGRLLDGVEHNGFPETRTA